MLDVSSFGTGVQIKHRLCDENIYVKRFFNNSLLFNFHIGINEQAVTALLAALNKISSEEKEYANTEMRISDKFIIPYPPGVPLVFPGDTINDDIRNKLHEYRQNGVLIIAA